MKAFLAIVWLASASLLHAQLTTSALVAWEPSPSPEADGYKIYQGPATRKYTNNYVVVPSGRLVSSYVLTNLTCGYTYFITATATASSNGLESDYSNEVAYLVPFPTVIITGPADTTNSIGNTQTFTVVATGGDLTYQWLKDGDPLVDGGSVSGALTATLTLTLTGPEMGAYSVYVRGPGGGATSATARLSVIPAAPVNLRVTERLMQLALESGNRAGARTR